MVLAAWPPSSSWILLWAVLSVGAGLLCMFMINLAAKALKLFPKTGWITNWVFALAMAGLVTWFAPHQWSWLPVSMLTGVVVHIVGDMITTGGVPLLWPIVIKPPKFLAETAGAQRDLEGQRRFFHSVAGPGRLQAGMARADSRERATPWWECAWRPGRWPRRIFRPHSRSEAPW